MQIRAIVPFLYQKSLGDVTEAETLASLLWPKAFWTSSNMKGAAIAGPVMTCVVASSSSLVIWWGVVDVKLSPRERTT